MTGTITQEFNQMKKLILLSALLIFACSSDDSTSDINNSYFFEIELGGETHEIRGNITDNFNPFSSLNSGYVSSQQLLQFSIGDKSADNYISGQNLSISMVVDNMSIGNNSGSLNFAAANAFFTDYMESIGVNYPFYVFFSENQAAPYLSNSMDISNIMITDLGTAPSTWNQDGCNAPAGGTCYGETLKGSYESVLYFIDGSNPLVYNTPVPIKIRFSLPRLN
tara:strand:- start:821 stop:1489 length:669 start_codon:yes stop_codon:yes gene_type:complete